MTLTEDTYFLIGDLLEEKGLTHGQIDEYFLEHHGVKGQRWGVRKAQVESAARATQRGFRATQRGFRATEHAVKITNEQVSFRGPHAHRNEIILGIGASATAAFLAYKGGQKFSQYVGGVGPHAEINLVFT